MASTYTSTPRSTHSHPHSRGPSAVTDTPTPSSHSHNNSLNPPLSSIRPINSTKVNLADAALKRRATLTGQGMGGGGLRAGSPNTLGREAGGPPRSTSRLSKASSSQLFESELEALSAGEPIMRDNTELDRINKENSIQRMIGDLQADRLSLSSSGASSVGEILNDDEEQEQDRRRQFADEDGASSSSSSRSSSSRSRSSLSSFRIGLASRTSVDRGNGGVGAGRRKDPLDPLDAPTEDEDHTEDDITYVTLPRSNANDSPARNPPPSARPAGSGLFGSSPRPFAFSSSSPLRPSQRYGDENVPPRAPSSAPYSFTRSPQTSGNSNTYPSLPARSNPPPSFIRSPATAAAATGANKARPSPLNPQVNSPILGNSPTATATYTGSGSRSGLSGHRSVPSFSAAAQNKPSAFSPRRQTGVDEGEGETTSFYHFPNATVLTEAIRSPEKGRYRSAAAPVPRVSPAAKKEKEKEKGGSAGSGSGSGNGSGGSSQANLVSHALSSLTTKLSLLERENASSAARVAQLEAELAFTSAQKEREHDDDVKQLRREVEGLLSEERKRSQELEEVVRSLRAQNTHLDAVLAQQHADLDSLRRRPVPPSPQTQPQPAPAFSAGEELRGEVRDLKQGLEVLGYEVEGVRTVVEDLLRDKEEREKEGGWEREEEERRRGFAQDVDTDATPRASRINGGSGRKEMGAGTFEVPGTPGSEYGQEREREESRAGSFVSDADLSLLRAEQELETARRTPRTSRRQQVHLKKPSSHHHHVHRAPTVAPPASPTDSEASYRPSTATFDGESVSYSQEGGYEEDGDEEDGFLTPATSISSASSSAGGEDEAETLPPLPTQHAHRSSKSNNKAKKAPSPPHHLSVDEPDFKRAEAIFADVSRATSGHHHHHNHHSSSPHQHQHRRATRSSSKSKKTDRVVLVEEPSERLCTNCWGRKKDLEVSEAEEKVKAQAKRAAKEKEKKVKEEKEKQREKEEQREEHRRTLEGVLGRLEEEFGVQKKIYLELTSEYQLMTSLTSTSERRALADHLKASIDVLEDKAREVKRYADALDDLYDAMHHHSCPAPSRKRHAVV